MNKRKHLFRHQWFCGNEINEKYGNKTLAERGEYL
ncbi:hypothetical protein PAE9249_00646 [Paenibacillus sp. CECT 9249]|nr:hypothetical protein PAE9249_00646 [Paenibacillus sp. CECT 9249]